ncbi:MAG: glycoside hydrolase family 43 protein [Chloroflexi bacterium]|nr:glycoside hydrolase family 43 protein [Chloroflexota bacterium]
MAPQSPNTFTNPILPGGYPDPSICRVGNDFYLVNSSFEYFPGLPLHHSKDLVNWELVGYGLHRADQCVGEMNLVDVQSRGGIHAPTLRYHEGTFYLITTNVYVPPGDNQPTQFINFILTAQEIAGPWSEPHILPGAPGIDPDIFFDTDGKVWVAGTHSPTKPNFPGEGEIWLQEIDLANWRLIGERYFLWRGACGGVWVEGPHLYKRDGRYYLIVAEGGTSFNHAVMVAVSDAITGPYTPNPRNPILSSRHLSYDYWVNSVGHADMVELADGRWFMVALGIRNESGRGSNMGRETHLIPITWEREPFEWQEIKYEWPVCAPATGRVERFNPLPLPNNRQNRSDAFFDNFSLPTLHPEWNFRRVPLPDTYSLHARKNHLRLFARPEDFQERGRCSFLGLRQKESDFTYAASLEFWPTSDGVDAGIVLFQQDNLWLKMVVRRENGRYHLRLVFAAPDKAPALLAQETLPHYSGEIILQVAAGNGRYHYTYSLDKGVSFQPLAETAANLILSRGYTGAYLGVLATGNGQATQAYADFAWVRYVMRDA